MAQAPEPSRPHTVADVVARMSLFRSPEALRRGMQVRVDASDVFVSTYPKSGTTWLQQVVHGVRSGGSMEFEEICEAVPWLESAWDMGLDPDAPQRWEPRVFKAHLEYERIPKGGRYITAFRHPRDVLASFYRFFEGWLFEPGSISLEDFAETWFFAGTESGRYWDHIVSWWRVRGRGDVLVLSYEDMTLDPDQVVDTVATFLGIELDDATRRLVVHQSSRQFMAANADRFDEHLLRAYVDPRMGLPTGGVSDKVNAGTSKVHISAVVEARLNQLWTEQVAANIGVATYEELRDAIKSKG